MLPILTNFRSKDTYRLKMKGWKRLFHTNGSKNRAEMAMLISDKRANSPGRYYNYVYVQNTRAPK